MPLTGSRRAELATLPAVILSPRGRVRAERSTGGNASRINVHERYEVEYWSKKFGVTADQLRAAVAKVGVSAKAVEDELKRR